MKRAVKLSLVVAMLAVGLLGLAACGEDSEEPARTTSSTTAAQPVDPEIAAAAKAYTGLDLLRGPATVEELQSRIDTYQRRPQQLTVDEPLPEPSPSGRTVAQIVCGVPVCQSFFDAAEAAASEIDWRMTKVDLGASPEEFVAAYNRAIELKPDVVVGSGIAREFFERPLATLAEMDIPVLQFSSPIAPVDDEIFVLDGLAKYRTEGVMMAEYVALASELDASVVVYYTPESRSIETVARTVEEYLPVICSDCEVDLQVARLAEIGRVGAKATARVAANPDTRYVICSFGDMCAGVSQALAAAGRNAVGIVTAEPSTTNLDAIKSGGELASVVSPTELVGWAIVDTAQRIVQGVAPPESRTPLQLVTKEQVESEAPDELGTPPDFKDDYLGLWHVR